MLIWLVSFPRSGSTLFRTALKTFGVKSYSIHGDRIFLRSQAGRAVGHEPLPEEGIDGLRALPEPYWVKTHWRHDEHHLLRPTDRVAYIARDGRDALVSLAHYRMWHDHAPGTYRDVLARVIREEGWSEHVMGWAYGHTPRPFITYDALVTDPQETVRKAAQAVGMDLGVRSETMPTFGELQATLPRFFRRGVLGSHRTEMPADLELEFWKRHGEAMELLGYASKRCIEEAVKCES